jgi:hypothetical protein
MAAATISVSNKIDHNRKCFEVWYLENGKINVLVRNIKVGFLQETYSAQNYRSAITVPETVSRFICHALSVSFLSTLLTLLK